MNEWAMDHVGWILLAVGAATVAGMLWLMSAESDRYDAFMAECLKDRKGYECQALWGQANPPTPVHNVYVP